MSEEKPHGWWVPGECLGTAQALQDLHHETHLPTFQDPPSPHTWLFSSHEKPRWACGYQCAPGQRPQAPGGLSRLLAFCCDQNASPAPPPIAAHSLVARVSGGHGCQHCGTHRALCFACRAPKPTREQAVCRSEHRITPCRNGQNRGGLGGCSPA